MRLMATLQTWARRAPLRGLIDLAMPPHCALCGEMGAWLCTACSDAILALRQARQAALPAPPGIATLAAVAPHRGLVRRVVHQLKYGGMRVLAAPLAELMMTACPHALAQIDLIVPVPLHPRRIRRRGYNQAVLLAEAPTACSGRAASLDLVERTRDTRSQVGLSRSARQANVDGAFAVRQALAGERLLLIDDVCTTGATLSACAIALREAGASHVTALTLAWAERYRAPTSRNDAV